MLVWNPQDRSFRQITARSLAVRVPVREEVWTRQPPRRRRPADFPRALVTLTPASEQVVLLLRCQRVLRHNMEVKSSIAFDEEHAIRGGVAACCVSIVAARLHQV